MSVWNYTIRIHAFGGVVQLVRTPACHAGGREFEPRRPRQLSERAWSISKPFRYVPLFQFHIIFPVQNLIFILQFLSFRP